MDNFEAVDQHYSGAGFSERISAALANAGLGEGLIDWSAVSHIDQFHVRGVGATEELAKLNPPSAEDKVLDVGSGFGGPARFLAATYGCDVTGIDLSQDYVDTATMLTERTGLSNKARFIQGNALELPFPDASFDHVWTQHVAMNIGDRQRLYSEMFRVLKPGGVLSIYDVIKGSDEPLIFPVPWANSVNISFLLNSDQTRQVLAEAGFTEVEWRDTTDSALAWFASQQQVQQQNSVSNSLNFAALMGPQFIGMAQNLGRNLKEGKARMLQAVMRKAE